MASFTKLIVECLNRTPQKNQYYMCTQNDAEDFVLQDGTKSN